VHVRGDPQPHACDSPVRRTVLHRDGLLHMAAGMHAARAARMTSPVSISASPC
jgi:hypothetical protein